jgi:hypothetical protein
VQLSGSKKNHRNDFALRTLRDTDDRDYVHARLAHAQVSSVKHHALTITNFPITPREPMCA